jgi:hypothetical protein
MAFIAHIFGFVWRRENVRAVARVSEPQRVQTRQTTPASLLSTTAAPCLIRIFGQIA